MKPRRAVIDLASSRPVWRIPPASIREIKSAFGTGWRVAVVRAAGSSDGDGGPGTAAAVEAARGAEVYMGWGVAARVVTATGGALRWAHTAAAGAGASITPALRVSGAVLTNSPGIQSDPMADWGVVAIGYCLRGFHEAVSAQRERRWAKDALTDGSIRQREFAGTRVGIVGLGGVGAALARRCAGLGMEVRAVRRRVGRRRPRGVVRVAGPRGLPGLAAWADVLFVATPHTAATTRLIDDSVLRRMRRGSYLVNVARGAVVDEDAVLDALESGRLAGCVLDVFEREPLPPGHRFWAHPRVLVFPHSSAVSDRFWERQTGLIVDNVARYLAGRRLRNVVDLDAGY